MTAELAPSNAPWVITYVGPTELLELLHAGLITHDEARDALGLPPMADEDKP